MFECMNITMLIAFSSETVLDKNTNFNMTSKNIVDIQVYSSVKKFTSSCPEELCKKTTLIIFWLFTGTHPVVKLVKLQAEGSTCLLQVYILLLLPLHYKCTLYVFVLHPSNHLHQHWMSFLSSNLMEEIDPNPEDLSTEHTTFNL